jgi:hypothetical protein
VGSIAFIATYDSIVSVDLSNPKNPVTLNHWWEGAYELTIDGDRAYYAHDFGNRSCVFGSFDISDPTQFTNGSSIVLEHQWPICSGPFDIDARGDTVIIGTGIGFRIVDVADPLTPFEVIHMDLGAQARAVLLFDGLALVSTSTGVTIFDLDDRENPVAIGYWGSAIDLAEFRDRVLVATDSGSVFLLDLTNPTDPVATDRLVTSNGTITGASTDRPDFVTAHGPDGLTASSLDRSCLSPRRSPSRKTP